MSKRVNIILGHSVYQIQKVQNLTIKGIQTYRSHIPFCCKAEDNEIQISLYITDY